MNKARRHELKMLKYKKRMKKFKKPFLREDGEWDTFAYRSHSCPCSCMACQQPEYGYNRAKEKSKLPQLIDFELNYDAGEMQYNHEKGIFIYSKN
jgi:hypothetical protein